MYNFFIDFFSSLWAVLAATLRAAAPLIIGLVLAYLMNTPVEWVRSKISGPQYILSSQSPKGRGYAILITYAAVSLIIIAILYAFSVLILGALPSGGINDTVSKISEYFTSSLDSIGEFISNYVSVNPDDPKNALLGWLSAKLSFSSVMQFAATFAESLVSFFVGFVASIYLLKDKEFFLSLWQKFLSIVMGQKNHGITNEILSEINTILTTFIKGALVDSLIVALLSSVALSAIKVPFAVIIGLVGGILNIIPYFGPFFGMIPAFLSALVSGGIGRAVVAVLLLLGVQQIDSNYIYPKIVGSSTGLHPLFVLLSVSVFGYFFGVVGMLLAVPIAGIIQILIGKWVYSK